MSYKGTTWKRHIYSVKRGNTYIYPEDYRKNLRERRSVSIRTRYSDHTSKLKKYDALTDIQKVPYQLLSQKRENDYNKRAVKGNMPSLSKTVQKGLEQKRSSGMLAIENVISSVGKTVISGVLNKASESVKAATGIKSVSKAVSGVSAISKALKTLESKVFKR